MAITNFKARKKEQVFLIGVPVLGSRSYYKSAMFRFNFQIDERNKCDQLSGIVDQIHPQDESTYCHEVFPNHSAQESNFSSLSVSEMKFMIRDLNSAEDVPDLDFLISYKDCDIIPTIYEGGLKVWECTFDLLSFLNRIKVDFVSKNVLDLGCGCGLLGIFAGLEGAKVVHFQDYNVEVLKHVTIPNVLKNNVKCKTQFFDGDWSAFALSNLTNIKYDYILSSETLYNVSNYHKLCKVFLEKLSERGKVMIASKSYYFGVGGTVKQFMDFLKEQNIFACNSIWRTAEGVQREILIIDKILQRELPSNKPETAQV